LPGGQKRKLGVMKGKMVNRVWTADKDVIIIMGCLHNHIILMRLSFHVEESVGWKNVFIADSYNVLPIFFGSSR